VHLLVHHTIKESCIQKLILNCKRLHGLIHREWRNRRTVEYHSVKSPHTNTKATKLSRLVFHKDMLLCSMILITNNALVKMLVASVFQVLGFVTKCKLYFHYQVHFIFSHDLKIFGISFVTRLFFFFRFLRNLVMILYCTLVRSQHQYGYYSRNSNSLTDSSKPKSLEEHLHSYARK
jgi:hypothetical protein